MQGHTVTTECHTNMSAFALLLPCETLPSTHLDLIDATVMENNDCFDCDDDVPELVSCEFADTMFFDIEKKETIEHANDFMLSVHADLDTMPSVSVAEGADVNSDDEDANYLEAFIVPRDEGTTPSRIHLPEEQADAVQYLNKGGAIFDTGSEWSWIPRAVLDQAGIDVDSVVKPIPSDVKETLPVRVSHYVRLRLKTNDPRASA